MTPTQHKALQALLTCGTKAEAAKTAGISTRTLQTYLATPEFQKEYKKAFGQLVQDATRQAQHALSPAIKTLRAIVEDEAESSTARIAAARSLLEFGLRLTELSDILAELEAVEGTCNVL